MCGGGGSGLLGGLGDLGSSRCLLGRLGGGSLGGLGSSRSLLGGLGSGGLGPLGGGLGGLGSLGRRAGRLGRGGLGGRGVATGGLDGGLLGIAAQQLALPLGQRLLGAHGLRALARLGAGAGD